MKEKAISIMNIPALIFTATITFSPFAGIMAYIITYEEYKHHFDPKRARRQALYMGIFSFLVFVAVGVISGYAFNHVVSQ